MLNWWNALSGLEQIFYIIAIPATLILLLQTILLLIGLGHGGGEAGHDLDAGADVDGGPDVDIQSDMDIGPDGTIPGDLHPIEGVPTDGHELSHPADSHDSGLHLFTLRGIVAFFTVFGWVGIALLDLHLPPILAIFLAFAAGLIALFLVAILMKLIMEMQQSGNLDLVNAIGLTGEVYVPIHDGGKGKVTVIVQERFLELDAIAPGHTLKTGQMVRVIALAENNTLVVEPLSHHQA